jgi:hypothetical protein
MVKKPKTEYYWTTRVVRTPRKGKGKSEYYDAYPFGGAGGGGSSR